MKSDFQISQRVKFKDSVFKNYASPLFQVYKGHEFLITGFLIDDDDRPLTDHVLLRCMTGSIVVQGAVHASDIELVSSVLETSVFETSVDPSIAVDFMDAGISLFQSTFNRTPAVKTAAFEGAGGTFDGAGASADWTDTIGDVVSGAIETTASIAGGVGDTIGSIADGIGDVAGGILGALD